MVLNDIDIGVAMLPVMRKIHERQGIVGIEARFVLKHSVGQNLVIVVDVHSGSLGDVGAGNEEGE